MFPRCIRSSRREHDFFLELLEPLVELHVVLVRDGVVVLSSTSLAPVRLGREDALLALVAASGTSGYIAKFWPGEVIGKHGGVVGGVRGKNEGREDMSVDL
jgi:hypothetical protein